MSKLDHVYVGVLTHGCLSGVRDDLLRETVTSLDRAFPTAKAFESTVVFDNGSRDGSDAFVRECFGGRSVLYRPPDGNHSPGRGRNELSKLLAYWSKPPARSPQAHDVLVFSDDDVRWHEDAEEKLCAFWHEAPEDLVLVSGLFEPEWDWNTPRGLVEAAGVKVLVRDSAPAAAWSMRRRDVERVFPLDEGREGADYAACRRIVAAGGRVAQIDLAEHLGWELSLVGHSRPRGYPVDKRKWGL